MPNNEQRPPLAAHPPKAPLAKRSIDLSAAKRAPRPKQKNKASFFKKLAFFVGAACMMGLVLVTIRWFIDSSSRFALGPTAVQYFGGERFLMSETAALKHIEDGKTQLVNKREVLSASMEDTVFYDTAHEGCLLPVDMVYCNPRQTTFHLLPYFTKVAPTASGIAASLEKQTAALDLGFVYDGRDLYVFLEPVTVAYNNFSLSLPAFSYIFAPAGNPVVIFNATTKESMIETPHTEIKVTTSDYTVFPLSDSMENNEMKILLFTRPELLPSVFAS